jgi:ubiquinone/menaquinone biosynthesis C-methylase UbiE
MNNLVLAFPLYNYLKFCNESHNEKTILDCGAGGSNPPLSLFYEHGYKTYGIEICKKQLEKAKAFCKEKNMNLNIILGDMLKIPFPDSFFGFLFSYNTSVHMEKQDFIIALSEFHRVLKDDGLCYVNFLSENCDSYGEGKKISDGEYINIQNNEEILYVHYKDTEIESFLSKFEIIYKEERTVKRKQNEKYISSGFYEYILAKK